MSALPSSTLDPRSANYQDPTALTDKAIERQNLAFDAKILAGRELFASQIDGIRDAINARIEWMEKHREERADAGFRYVDTAVEDLRTIIQTRMEGMDIAMKLFQERSAEQITQLKHLHQEKFDSIAVQFAERDTRTEQTAAGVKIAVDAALQAAKEAVAEQNRSFALATGKSETAMTKQMDALGLAIQTANKGLDDKIGDLKDRLTRIEGMDLGASRREGKDRGDKSSDIVAAALELQRTQTAHGGTANVLTVAVGIVAVLGLLLSAFVAIRQPSLPSQIIMGPPKTGGLSSEHFPLTRVMKRPWKWKIGL